MQSSNTHDNSHTGRDAALGALAGHHEGHTLAGGLAGAEAGHLGHQHREHEHAGLTGTHHSTGLTGNTGSGLTGHSGSGLTGNTGTGLTGNTGTGLTGNTGTGLTGHSGTGLTGNTGSGLTGNTGSGLTGNSGTHHGLGHHDQSSHVGRDAAIGAGVAGEAAHLHNQHANQGTTGFTGAHNTGFPNEGQHSSHVGRDAAIGAGVAGEAAHLHNQHGNHGLAHNNDEANQTGFPQEGGVTGAGHTGMGSTGLGATGNQARSDKSHATALNPTDASNLHNKPTLADKIGGAVDIAIGSITKNPARVEQGEIRKTGGSQVLDAHHHAAVHPGATGLGHDANAGAHVHDPSNVTGTGPHTGSGFGGTPAHPVAGNNAAHNYGDANATAGVLANTQTAGPTQALR